MANAAALAAVSTTLFGTDKIRTAFVISTDRMYFFDPLSSATADGVTVIQPSAGSGRWRELVVTVAPTTLASAYLNGSSAANQTLSLTDADGGGFIVDGSGGGFTGALAFRVNTAAGSPVVVVRATGYVGIGVAAPAAPLEIPGANGSNTAILLSRSAAHQRIEKTSTGGLSIVVPNTATATGNYLDLVMGSTRKISIEAGNNGGPQGVITFNNDGIWTGTFAHWSTGQTFIKQTVFNGSTQVLFGVYSAALTAQNGSVDLPDVMFDLSHTVQQIGGTNHATMRAFQILAPTYSATTALTIDDTATVYISGAPGIGANYTATRREALWIGSANGGGIRTDGLGSTGLIKNNNGTVWTIAQVGVDYVAPWSLTNESVVVSAGGSALTEDNAWFFYRTSKHRLHVYGQAVMGTTVGFWLAGGPAYPFWTTSAEDFDATELTGAFRDTGPYGPTDNMIAWSTGGFPSTVMTSQGLYTYALQARYLYGGTENGREDSSPLVIYGGSAAQLLGLQIRATRTFSATSGTQRGTYINYLGAAGGFAPTSGTAVFRPLSVEYEINQTGGANGTITGLYVDATVTALVGTHYLAQFGARSRKYFRVEDQNTSAYAYIGEQSTGFGAAALFFHTNVRQAYIYLDDGNMLTINSGGLTATALAGTGTQFVQANATGVLSRFTGVVPIASATLTGPAVVWTNGSGLLNVDTTRFVYDSTNFKVLVPNGTVTHPGVTPIGDPNTGEYSYAADVLGWATGGRHTLRITSDATSRFAYIGEGGTGISGYAWLQFETNVRAAAIYLENAVGNTLISTVGWLYPNGSAAGPAVAWSNSTDTGRYRYAAGVEAVAAAGRYVSRWESDATNRWTYIGEQSTGITGYSMLSFHTNVRASSLYCDNASGNMLICTTALRIGNDVVIGLSRTSAGILSIDGTSVDVPALSAGGVVYAAPTTGRLAILTIGSGLSLVGSTLTATGTTTSPAGSDTQVQYNDGGVFGAEAAFTYQKTNNRMTLGGATTGNTTVMISSGNIELEESGGGTQGVYKTTAGELVVGTVHAATLRLKTGNTDKMTFSASGVDVPSLSAGGMVIAAITTGRLSVVARPTKVPFLSGYYNKQPDSDSEVLMPANADVGTDRPGWSTDDAYTKANFRVNVDTATLVGDGSATFRFYKNGVDQGLIFTQSNGSTGHDDSGEFVVTVAQGDDVKIVIDGYTSDVGDLLYMSWSLYLYN